MKSVSKQSQKTLLEYRIIGTLSGVKISIQMKRLCVLIQIKRFYFKILNQNLEVCSKAFVTFKVLQFFCKMKLHLKVLKIEDTVLYV